MISGKKDSANNFARGYRFRKQMIDEIRNNEYLKRFCYESLYEGVTGSGLACYLLDILQ